MNRLFLALTLVLLSSPLAAQYRGPRSGDYLFGASAWGARALWVNPAAQGSVDEASLMLEGVVARDPADNFPLAQYTIGFNSRGFGFGFRHDYFKVDVGAGPDSLADVGGNTWRAGFGRGLNRMAIGAAVSIHSGPDTKQSVDIGFLYRLQPSLRLAFALENIGQPTVRDSSLRFGGRAGLSWTGFSGVLGMDLEARGYDREVNSGIAMAYRGGLRLQTPGNVPFVLTGVVELGDSFTVDRLLLGLSVGGEYLGGVVAGGSDRSGSKQLTDVSVLGLASKRFR